MNKEKDSVLKDENINQDDLKYQLAIKPRKFIFKSTSQTKFIWDVFIILTAIYTCF